MCFAGLEFGIRTYYLVFATPGASFIIKGLTKAHVPYMEERSQAAIVPLKSFGNFVLFVIPASVTSVVPAIIPR